MPKSEPLRKCIVCGERKTKEQLLRVVRTPSGDVVVDGTGKMNGRGAYLCRTRECVEKARKKNRLQAALKVRVPEEFYDELIQGVEE